MSFTKRRIILFPYAVTKVLHQQALLSLAVPAKNGDRADHDSGHGRGHTEHMREDQSNSDLKCACAVGRELTRRRQSGRRHNNNNNNNMLRNKVQYLES